MKLGDVGAGDERLLPGAGDRDNPDVLGVAQLGERGPQIGQHLAAQRVTDLRPVDGDDGQPVGDLDGEGFPDHGLLPAVKAGMPVSARPMIRVCTSSVPS